MKIRHISGAVAEVEDDYGQTLVATGQWEPAEKRKRARHAKTATPKPSPAPETPEAPAEQ